MTDFFASIVTLYAGSLIVTYLVSTVILTILMLINKPKLAHVFLWCYGSFKLFTMAAPFEMALVLIAIDLLVAFATSKLIFKLIHPQSANYPQFKTHPKSFGRQGYDDSSHTDSDASTMVYSNSFTNHQPSQASTSQSASSISQSSMYQSQSSESDPSNWNNSNSQSYDSYGAFDPDGPILNNEAQQEVHATNTATKSRSTWDMMQDTHNAVCDNFPIDDLIHTVSITNSAYFDLISTDKYKDLIDESQKVISEMWNNYNTLKYIPALKSHKTVSLLATNFAQLNKYQKALTQLKYDYHTIFNGGCGEQVAMQLAQLSNSALLLENISVPFEYSNGRFGNNQMDGIAITEHGVSILEVKNYNADKLSIEDKDGINDLMTKYNLTLRHYDKFGVEHKYTKANRYDLLDTIHEDQKLIVYRKANSDDTHDRIVANYAINTQIDQHREALIDCLRRYLPGNFYPQGVNPDAYLDSIIGTPLVYLNYNIHREPRFLEISFHGSFGTNHVPSVAINKLTDYLNHQTAHLTFEHQQTLFATINEHQSPETEYDHAEIVDLDHYQKWLSMANDYNNLIKTTIDNMYE